eukprot:11714952-Ditylum_brightwellii.AAC.1
MKAEYEIFQRKDVLQQSQHMYDTKNEGMNTAVTRYAPKHKTYSISMSLTNRISIAIGLHNAGSFEFWKDVYEKLDMDLPP